METTAIFNNRFSSNQCQVLLLDVWMKAQTFPTIIWLYTFINIYLPNSFVLNREVENGFSCPLLST